MAARPGRILPLDVFAAVNAALGLIELRPAPRPLVLALAHGAGARRAADRGVALRDQRMQRQLAQPPVLADVLRYQPTIPVSA